MGSEITPVSSFPRPSELIEEEMLLWPQLVVIDDSNNSPIVLDIPDGDIPAPTEQPALPCLDPLNNLLNCRDCEDDAIPFQSTLTRMEEQPSFSFIQRHLCSWPLDMPRRQLYTSTPLTTGHQSPWIRASWSSPIPASKRNSNGN